ncbi:zinc-finger homeodomain protein 11-like [Silene latifolia]|uniref:zinc-finger homeodomain protein 11-like n=1 Tax=Silene latifolia TaxID=37657 RepID=UPI003D772614
MHITITTKTTNGVLKRHKPYNDHHVIVAAASVLYKECLKNHAASMGRHLVDGCGEFMPSLTATVTDPTSIRCEACGCHRNFHRCEYSPQHRHYPVEARRKRFRTKFSKEQKEKMMEFAVKVGWKVQKCKQELVSVFCKEIGVETGVFKVWMHNNKHTFIVKRSGNTNYENSSSNNNNNNSHTNASSSSS